MRARRYLYIVIVALCLVLFYSLHLMTNNIDKDRLLSSSDNEDKRMLLQFKENVAQLREQINANEEKISQIKALLSDLQLSRDTVYKNDSQVKKTISDVNKILQLVKPGEMVAVQKDGGSFLKCSASTIKNNNGAEIQMSQILEKLPFDNPDGGVWKQGYDITYKAVETETSKLKVFVVPHSHCDPGWIKTFEQYFNDQASHILDLAVDKLIEYPSMRFVYAEMSFFSLWWKALSTDKRETVKKLLDEKRLEVVTGGWVMSDEANSHYFAMLDQLIEGNQWLFNQLGYKPTSGWAIDPFGHSPTMAYLLKRVGLKNMLIQRTHYAVKKELSLGKKLEFRWRQSWDDTGTTDMLCHMMPFYSYDVPHTCGPDPKICCQFDFRRSHGSRFSCPWRINPMTITDDNVEERASTLLDQYRKKATLYKNNIVLVPLGDDFRYDVVEEWDKQFNNYAKLFAFMNKQTSWNVEAKFATLSEYFDELRSRGNLNEDDRRNTAEHHPYPSLSGDFFVYADRDKHYWSGYFTSRPFYKRLDRELEHHQRTAEQLLSLALASSRSVHSTVVEESSIMADLVQARRYLGLFQHHDGITGTSKAFVVEDYGAKLLASIVALKKVIGTSAAFLLSNDVAKFSVDEAWMEVDETRPQHWEIASATVLSLEDEAVERMVYFHNSLGQSRRSIVSIHVTWPHVEVTNQKGEVLESQVDPVWSAHDFFSLNTGQYKLHFVADIPAVGLVGFKLKRVSSAANPLNHLSSISVFNAPSAIEGTIPFEVQQEENASVENEVVKVSISTSTGLSESMEWKEAGPKREMNLEFVRYGTTSERDRSGAYLFMPDGEATVLIEPNPGLRVTKGPLLNEATTKLSLVQHSLRCYSTKAGVSSAALDVFNIVDIRDTSNTELAMRIRTDVHNEAGVFFTDLNGFQVIKRKHLSNLPIQANFYPMPTSSHIQDTKHRFTLLTGQSLGVASLKAGWLEVMQDRRLDQDDNRGMEQAVKDNKATPNRFRLLFEAVTAHGDSGDSGGQHDHMGFMTMASHFSSLDLLYPVFTLPLSTSLEGRDLKGAYSALKGDLPCDLHLVNLRSLVEAGGEEDGGVWRVIPSHRSALILHRTAFDCGFQGLSVEAVKCSDASSTVSSLFSHLKVTKLAKTSLNLLNNEKEGDDDNDLDHHHHHSLSSLSPMEISAFVFQFQ